MRALWISDVYFPRVNGVSTSIATFRAGLADAGVATSLVVPQYGDEPDAADTDEVLRVPAGAVPRDPEDRCMRWGVLRAVLDSLRHEHFDLVHVQTPFLAHYAGLRFARARGIPVVETYHTFFEEYLHHYVPLLPRFIGRGLARGLTRAQCNAVDAVVAPSQPMADMLTEIGVRSALRVIPTGLPADRFRRGDGARFRQCHGLPEGRPLLLYVGRVAHEKNIEFLIHSYLEVWRARPAAFLVIAGEGPARSSLAAQVNRLGLAGDVAFVGYLDREQSLADCYAAADVFVFASRTETQGLVLLEAMAQGCAVVSTAERGTASILQPGCGARVAPEQPEVFAQAVIDLLDDPARAARCGARAREYARGWSAGGMAGQLCEFYAEQCARAKIARGCRRRHPGSRMSAKRALIVDDSRSARTFLTRILERYDLQVDAAASAEEAIEYLIRQRPDVIFLDHLMPGMDGFQALAAIKTNPRTATIPVMMYTSQEGELYLSQARALGAMGVLPKQTRPADVSLALEKLRLLGERRPESEIATVRVPSLRDDGEFHKDTTRPAAVAPPEAPEPPEPLEAPLSLEVAASPPPGGTPASGPSAGLTPEMRAQLALMLREHGSELRRFVAQSLAQQSGQIISELRTLLDDAAAPAAPVEPVAALRDPDRRGVSVLWLGVVAALIAALAGLLWYRSAGEQGRAGAGAEQPRSGVAPALPSGTSGRIAATDKPAAMATAAGAPGNVRPAPLLAVPVPFGEAPFAGARIDAVQAALARLVAAGFSGIVELRSFPGRYCLQGAGDTVALPAGELSYSKCDQIGNPVDAAGSAEHESVAFANMVSAARSRSHGTLDVQLSSGNADEVITPYPPVTAFLTTGEWNRAAATNNRVEVRARPQP